MNEDKWDKTAKAVDNVLYVLIIIHSFMFALHHYSSGHNSLVYAGFVLIGILSFYGIMCEKQCISIKKIIYIFSYIFFFLAPWQQYSEGAKAMWPGVFLNYTDELHLKANTSILLFLLFFICSSEFCKRRKHLKNKKSDIMGQETMAPSQNIYIYI